jgi:hypothetical protein
MATKPKRARKPQTTTKRKTVKKPMKPGAPTPYEKWAKDPSSRWIDCGHTFGRHLMASVRDYAFERIPKGTRPRARALAKKAALDAIYGMMMLLDGIPWNGIDEDHHVRYALEARIIDSRRGSKVVERFELAPGGDELCMAYHGWVKDEFGD